MHVGEGLIAPPTARIYFHGIPGSADELRLAGVDPAHFLAPNRGLIAIGKSGAEYFDALAENVGNLGPTLHLVGFSLGAAAALQVAARLAGQVVKIDLIAAAAPPELGDFLHLAAGGAVFRMAANRPKRFAALVRAQSLLARHAPGLLGRALFANAAGADRDLARDPAFRSAIASILRTGLGSDPAGYHREISAYVAPWADLLASVTAPVTLWHGDADNCSPPPMAEALRLALPNAIAVHHLSGLSHYSTLKVALARVVEQEGA